MNNLEQIPQFMQAYRNCRLRVGFSGGADSTALLLLLLAWSWSPEALEAVHFDHGLRGEASKLDAVWCRQFCAELNVPFKLVELHLDECIDSAGSLEDLARQRRLQWYQMQSDDRPVVLAHHAGDVRENLLLKLARGGNVSSLCSLQEIRQLGKTTFLRPLLEREKSELENYLQNCRITDWRHDASNDSNEFHRNYLRNELLKKWCGYHAPVSSGLRRSYQVLAQDADFIEACAKEKLQSLGSPLPESSPCDFWRKLHPALLARILPDYLNQLAGRDDVMLTHGMLEHFQRVLAWSPSPEKRLIELGQGCSFTLKNDILCRWHPEIALPDKQLWDYRREPEKVWGHYRVRATLLTGAVDERKPGVFCFDAGCMPGVLFLFRRSGGEKMTVWGSTEPRRVKHLLSGCSDAAGIVLVGDEKDNIYLLGNLRRSTFAPVKADTVQTLRIEVVQEA